MLDFDKYFTRNSFGLRLIATFMIILLPSIYGLEYAHHEICSNELEQHRLHSDADKCESDHWHADIESDHDCNLCSLYLNKINAYQVLDYSSFIAILFHSENNSYYSSNILSEDNPNISSRAPPLLA